MSTPEEMQLRIAELEKALGMVAGATLKKSSHFGNPPRPINSMIVLEKDSWHLQDRRARLAAAKLVPANKEKFIREYERIIARDEQKFIVDYDATNHIDPETAKKYLKEYQKYVKKYSRKKKAKAKEALVPNT